MRSFISWLIYIYKLLIILFFYETKIPTIIETLYLSTKFNNQRGREDSNIKLPNYIRSIILSHLFSILGGVETLATYC